MNAAAISPVPPWAGGERVVLPPIEGDGKRNDKLKPLFKEMSMKRFVMYGMATAGLVAVMAASAWAQQGGREGRDRGRGFGAGFGGGGLGGLVAMPEVQKELKLSEGDAARLVAAINELRPRRGQGGGFGDFQNLSEEERQKRMEEFRKQMEENAKKIEDKIKSSLTEEQWKRLNELRLQREGVLALERPDVAEKLNLTQEQKDKIKELMADLRPQFGPGRGRRGEGGGPPNFEEMRARREKATADILAVLTPAQKSTWETLQGAKFEFPRPQFGGPGGGGRRGNRPAGE
jgi:hypothetical protein